MVTHESRTRSIRHYQDQHGPATSRHVNKVHGPDALLQANGIARDDKQSFKFYTKEGSVVCWINGRVKLLYDTRVCYSTSSPSDKNIDRRGMSNRVEISASH